MLRAPVRSGFSSAMLSLLRLPEQGVRGAFVAGIMCSRSLAARPDPANPDIEHQGASPSRSVKMHWRSIQHAVREGIGDILEVRPPEQLRSDDQSVGDAFHGLRPHISHSCIGRVEDELSSGIKKRI
jgi:hypothetical protein